MYTELLIHAVQMVVQIYSIISTTVELPYSCTRTALRAPWPCMDYYRTAPVPVLQLCSTMAIVPVAPSVPNQVQDRLSAVGLVMQAKTLALKSCSANQRWCNVGTKTTVL